MTRRRKKGRIDELARRTLGVLERFNGGIVVSLPQPMLRSMPDSADTAPEARQDEAEETQAMQ